jgi:hypothetical protein
MRKTHNKAANVASQCHQRASITDHTTVIPTACRTTTMLLTFIAALINAKPAYVWQPALTMTDPVVVSELTPRMN